LPASISAGFHGAGVAALPAVDIGQALGIARDHADHRVVLVFLGQVHGRHDADPVLVPAAGHVRLGAAYKNAFVVAAGDMHEHVRVSLLVRTLGAIAFRVGHGGGNQNVFALGFFQPVHIALVILGAVFLVDVIGDRMQHGNGVEAGAALETGAGDLAHAPLHLVFHHQIRGRFDDMQKAVHLGVDQR
jgi:hypothetical protein